MKLIYRGATYRVNRNEQGKVTAIAVSPKPFQKTRLKAVLARPFFS